MRSGQRTALVVIDSFAQVAKVFSQIDMGGAGRAAAALTACAAGTAPAAAAVGLAAPAFFGGARRLGDVLEPDLQIETLLQDLGEPIHPRILAEALHHRLLPIVENLHVDDLQREIILGSQIACGAEKVVGKPPEPCGLYLIRSAEHAQDCANSAT